MDGCRRRSETRSMSSQTSGPTVDESHELARRVACNYIYHFFFLKGYFFYNKSFNCYSPS
uniref:Uncharacterized protein LOC105129510 isoform X4 n=1 Tax=Rhizophora mucronata TaxID=61149 RepID=A0A2P2K4Q8_RHIMU